MVNEPIQNRICQSGIPDGLVPLVDWQLTGHHCATRAVHSEYAVALLFYYPSLAMIAGYIIYLEI